MVLFSAPEVDELQAGMALGAGVRLELAGLAVVAAFYAVVGIVPELSRP